MATVTGYTSERMKEIEDSTIVDGDVVGSNLILTRRDNTTINAGSVIGPQGVVGPAGPTSIIVCTSTTRPTGGSLFTGLAIYETDTKKFYIYDGGAWIYRGGTFICTSASRPTPFVGMEIYETDTKKSLIYNGVRWDPPWNYPWGVMGYAQSTTIQSGITTGSDVISLTLNLTYVANRRIKIIGYVNAQSSVAGDFGRLDITDATPTILNSSQLQIQGSGQNLNGFCILSPAAGTRIYKLRYGRTAGSGTHQVNGSVFTPNFILIEDIGPNGAPA
jgi:hypothetical protein